MSHRQKKLEVSQTIQDALFGLYKKTRFLGSALTIGPRLAITAGHHLNLNTEDVGELTLVQAAPKNKSHAESPKSKKKTPSVMVEFGGKVPGKDLLLLWLSSDVPFCPLRGWLPDVGSTVAVVYITPAEPHRDIIVSPGEVVSTTHLHRCTVKGTVTARGSSGAPVVCQTGDRVVGIHLAISDDSPTGRTVAEFCSARSIIDILIESGTNPHSEWWTENENEEQDFEKNKKKRPREK